MKNFNRLCLIALGFVFSLGAFAQEEKTVAPSEGFFIRNGVAYYIKGGHVNKVSGIQELGNGNSINGLGIITHADGKKSQLMGGEMADFSGNMMSAKLEEYVELQNGKAVIVTNGIVTPVESGLKLATGETMDEYGNISNGITLKTGDKIDINGNMIK